MDFTEYDEARLIQLAQSGSDGAIAELDARYRGMLVGFATAAIGNHADADEVAQSTLTKAFVRIDQFEAGTSFRSWLLQVARNTLADWHRTSARYRSAITSKREVEAMPQTPPAEIGIFEYARRILPERHYQVLWLKYVDQLSDDQIATELGQSSGSIRVLLTRVRRRLADFRVNQNE